MMPRIGSLTHLHLERLAQLVADEVAAVMVAARPDTLARLLKCHLVNDGQLGQAERVT
jgi:hypothetical protein